MKRRDPRIDGPAPRAARASGLKISVRRVGGRLESRLTVPVDCSGLTRRHLAEAWLALMTRAVEAIEWERFKKQAARSNARLAPRDDAEADAS